MSCSCCRTPRHKRLVDALFPEDPQNCDPLSGDLDKLLYFSRSEPDRLDDVGGYLVFKLRRSLARERKGHVCVSMKIMEKLLSELTTDRRQLLAESFLDMVHDLLHANQLFYHNLAANSFVVFSELEEDSPPYHRQYDFCIERFAAMCLVKKQNEQYIESRRAGLRALRGVVHKVGSEGGGLWESDHLNMIVPAFLINMQDHAHEPNLEEGNEEPERTSLGGREHLGELAEAGLKELVTIASLVHANVVLESILQHFDLSNVWLEEHQFAADTFTTITNTIQAQVRYLVIQALLAHVDTKTGPERQLKGVILDVLSRCVGIAADESIGPSVLDVFRTLMKHLKKSVEDPGESDRFHETIVRMVGEFAAVLPDFHNPDIMNLIFSYFPRETDGSLRAVKSKKESHTELVSLLVKCLLAVAESSKPSMLDSSMSESLLTSLSQLLEIREPDVQLDIILLWQRMVDHHGNKQKIQLNTTWESLGECNLVLGKTTAQFQYLARKILFPKLISLVGGLALRKSNVTECYYLLCLLGLEFGANGVPDTSLLATEIEDIAQTQPGLSTSHRYLLHSYTAGLLYLVSIISENDAIEGHVIEVLEERRSTMPFLLPDSTVQQWEDPLADVGGPSREETRHNLCLFQMREKGLVQQTPEMMRNSSMFTRYHNWEAGRSFRSHSIDQDEDKESIEITFEHFKMESTGVAVDPTSTDKPVSTDTAMPSFEEMMDRVAHKSSIRDDVSDILKSASPRSTEGTSRPLPSIYDIETPSFH